MEIYFEKENKTKKIVLKTPITLKELLKKLDVNLDSIILVKNDEICLEDEIVTNKDKIKLLSVVSGG
mgnify:CR=1 FL=1